MKSKTNLKNYVLIDYENVQPKNLSLLTEDYFSVYLFLGAKQKRLNVELVEAMHKFGTSRAKYIQAKYSQANALDFHVTYYLGELVSQSPDAYFHIISKDKGFDPLISHLNDRKVKVTRRNSVADIPVLSVKKNAVIEEKFKAVVMNLQGRGHSKPRREKSLKNTMKNTFKEELTDAEVESLFTKLVISKYILTDGHKVSYSLPK